jgi:chemotaxis protein MotA
MKIRSIWFGLVALGFVMHVGIFGGFSDLTIFFNTHALALVFGGTIAITLLSYSFKMVSELFDFLIYGFFLKKASYDIEVVYELLTTIYQNKSPFFDPKQRKFNHMFVLDGINLLRQSHMKPDEVYDAMAMRVQNFKIRYQAYAKVLLNISKYPPALGLLGASTGMIQMMTNLGVGGPEAMGKAMAVALTATFWGIGLANFVFLPLADYAFQLAEDDNHIREVIAEAIVKEKEGVSFESLSEMITFGLDINEQVAVRKALGQFIAKYSEPAAAAQVPDKEVPRAS